MSPNKVSSWEIEVSEKTGRPVRWAGQNWAYYRKLMELAFDDEDVFTIATGTLTRDLNWTPQQVSMWDSQQRKIQRMIFAS
ncbi:hypothetical protein F441_05968 [Phytophthora nicotianae CJ01A1]|uniref:Uncharacterized protein n=1 Tax=Phytophthora nicotianae CJ01A1 TaxID=1317063 RepID=W2XCR8_PHYNI|nr:hypothetical protein F441_05968 [Phytophthora nicotianae CJ01A1]